MASVTLRDVTPDDLDVLFAQQRDPKTHHMVAFSRRSPDDEAAFRAHWAEILQDPAVRKRLIVEGEDVAGYLVQFVIDDVPEVGYWLGPAFWGRGIATAGLALFLAEIPIRPLFARVAQDNLGSVRVLRKTGFEILREERGFATARGEEIDEYVMRLG